MSRRLSLSYNVYLKDKETTPVSLLLTPIYPNMVSWVSNTVTLLLIPTVSLSGKVNSVISPTVLKLFLIITLLLVKLNGMSKLVLSSCYLTVWTVKVLNILQEEWKDSSNSVMMISNLLLLILRPDKEVKEERSTGPSSTAHSLPTISMLSVDKCTENSESL